MFQVGGMQKMRNAAGRNGIVRFYVRGADGRFTSTKVTFMPKSFVKDIDRNDVGGEMLFVNHRGFIVTVKQLRDVALNSINFQSVKVVV